MKMRKRLIITGCVAVALLFVSQMVLSSPVQGASIIQKIRENRPIQTFLKNKVFPQNSILSKISEAASRIRSLLERKLGRKQLQALASDIEPLKEKLKEILSSNKIKSLLSNLKIQDNRKLSWFPGVLLVAAILAAIDATLLTYIAPIVSSPYPLLVLGIILFIRLCPIIKWIPKTIWAIFWVGQFTYWADKLTK
jgi:hypothetical protein